MTDSQALVCVFFQLPPGDQLFMRIHDIPWLVLLPQIEKLTYVLETLLVTNPSSMAMKTLIQARTAMERKMLPLRDAILSGRDLSIDYVEFINGVSQNRMLNAFVKEAQTFIVQEVTKKIAEAQQALSEFREELENVVSKIPSVVGGDNNNLSLFIMESTKIILVMLPAIEECSALLQECSETFQNIYKQICDPEAFERSRPSDAEFQLVGEKWKVLLNFLHSISADWDLLDSRMSSPHLNRATCDTVTPDVPDTAALFNIAEYPVNCGGSPDFPRPEKAQVAFWQKFSQRVSKCLTNRILNLIGRHSDKSMSRL